MSTSLASPVEMIRKGAPRLLRSDEELHRYTEELEKLTNLASPDADEWAAIELLTLLIEKYEQDRYPLPQADPIQVLRFLMDQHQLKQRDLAPDLGTESIVSEVLNGKRKLNKVHIQKLSARFRVSPAVFF
jgi:HTH-type transcriptional regulator/antitoxin HigA